MFTLHVTMEIESKNKEKPCSKVQKKRELKSLQNVFFHKAYVFVKRPMNKCILKQELHVAHSVMEKPIICKL